MGLSGGAREPLSLGEAPACSSQWERGQERRHCRVGKYGLRRLVTHVVSLALNRFSAVGCLQQPDERNRPSPELRASGPDDSLL